MGATTIVALGLVATAVIWGAVRLWAWVLDMLEAADCDGPLAPEREDAPAGQDLLSVSQAEAEARGWI